MYPNGRGEDVLIFLHDLIHLLLLCGRALSRGHGGGHTFPLTLRVNHEDEKVPFLSYDIIALLCRDERNGGRRCYLLYPIQFFAQSNNKSGRPRRINKMMLPQVWLA